MCDLGINPENFNPRILYILRSKNNCQTQNTYHTHEYIEFKYVISGSCTYNINETFYQVKKGDIIIINPGVSHGRVFSPGEEITEFHIGFSSICIRNLPKGFLIPQDACPVVSLTKYEHDLIKCYNEIISEQEKNEPGSDLILKSLVMKLIVIFLKETFYIENSGNGSLLNSEYYNKADLVNAITSFINENYMKNISLDKISKYMYLSSVYISKVFKEETGESPINYLIKVRLNKAKELLETSNLSIKSIAESIGYNDAYYFSKLYKKYFGCPPSRHKI